MKKILAIAVAVVMAMALSISVFADTIFEYEFKDPVDTAGSWWSNPADFTNNADFIAALQTEGAVLKITFDAAATGYQFGLQAQNGGYASGLIHSNFANGEGCIGAMDTVTEGDKTTITVDAPAFYAAAKAAIEAGGSTLDTWQWVNGQETGKCYSVVVETAAEAPAADETAEAPAADEAPAANDAAAPSTGIALAVIPAVIAMAAAAVSKKH